MLQRQLVRADCPSSQAHRQTSTPRVQFCTRPAWFRRSSPCPPHRNLSYACQSVDSGILVLVLPSSNPNPHSSPIVLRRSLSDNFCSWFSLQQFQGRGHNQNPFERQQQLLPPCSSSRPGSLSTLSVLIITYCECQPFLSTTQSVLYSCFFFFDAFPILVSCLHSKGGYGRREPPPIPGLLHWQHFVVRHERAT